MQCVRLNTTFHKQLRSYGDGVMASDWRSPGLNPAASGLQGEGFIHYITVLLMVVQQKGKGEMCFLTFVTME